MACNSISLTGITLDCGNVGGLEKLFIAPVESVSAVTVGTDGEISGITMVSGATFKTYSFRKGNANFAIAQTRDDKAGTVFSETTITFATNYMDKAKRTELNNLSKGNFHVIAKDNNGTYWFLAYNSYAAGSVAGQSGAERGEANSYTLTLVAQTNDLPNTVASSVMATIIS